MGRTGWEPKGLVLKGTRYLPNLQSPLGHEEGQRQVEGARFWGWVACREQAELAGREAGGLGGEGCWGRWPPSPEDARANPWGLFSGCYPAWWWLGELGAGHTALTCVGYLPRTSVHEHRMVTVPLGVGGED